MSDKKEASLFIRISEQELEEINRVWFDCVVSSGRAVSKSEFIRGILAAYCFKSREEPGEWIPIPYLLEYETDAKCSVCYEEVVGGINYKYCPNCGKRMKVRAQDD